MGSGRIFAFVVWLGSLLQPSLAMARKKNKRNALLNLTTT